MSYGIRLLPETERTLAFGAVGVGYTAIGLPFEHPIRIIYLANLTDALLTFSWNGINDHITLPENGFMLLDVMCNRSNHLNSGTFIAHGTTIYVRQNGIPTQGSVTLSVFYAVGD